MTTNGEENVLVVKEVGKEYRLYASPRERLKSLLTGKANYRSHWAVRDVSFQLKRGQCLGVIGDNGAGKSSLLKLIAGTIQPSIGSIERVGRLTAILELGAGFHPDFTGRDNLYFAGNLIGLSRDELASLETSILEFCELSDAIDRPVKTYSSGMTVRLAFALVTAVQPDVLIIDEALAVGDQHFQKKCVERIMAFRNNGCTILFCSHSPYHIRHLCDTAMWIEGGRIKEFGETEAVLGAYDVHTRLLNGTTDEPTSTTDSETPAESSQDKVVEALETVPKGYGRLASVVDDGSARILEVDLANLGDGDPRLLTGPDLIATIIVRGRGQECPNVGFMIEQSKGVGITSLATHEEGVTPKALGDGRWQSVLTFPNLPLHSGEYVVSAYLFDESGLVVYDQWFQFLHFKVVSPTLMPGLVRLPHHWS
jgi:lipopolysaccharide transport system ATP-binding protein